MNEQRAEVDKILVGLANHDETKKITVFVGGAAVRSSPETWNDLNTSKCMLAPNEINQLIDLMKKSAA
jgi:hypothetical protein